MIRSIEVHVKDKEVEVWRGHVLCFSFGIDKGGSVVINQRPNGRVVQGNTINLERLDVNISTTQAQEGSVAIPRLQVRPATEETIRAPRARAQTPDAEQLEDSLAPDQINTVLNMILDEKVFAKALTREETAMNSHIIAEELGIGVMQVAGVRAALSRGAYGRVDHLIESRRQGNYISV